MTETSTYQTKFKTWSQFVEYCRREVYKPNEWTEMEPRLDLLKDAAAASSNTKIPPLSSVVKLLENSILPPEVQPYRDEFL
jgi:hypothetical protein